MHKIDIHFSRMPAPANMQRGQTFHSHQYAISLLQVISSICQTEQQPMGEKISRKQKSQEFFNSFPSKKNQEGLKLKIIFLKWMGWPEGMAEDWEIPEANFAMKFEDAMQG